MYFFAQSEATVAPERRLWVPRGSRWLSSVSAANVGANPAGRTGAEPPARRAPSAAGSGACAEGAGGGAGGGPGAAAP